MTAIRADDTTATAAASVPPHGAGVASAPTAVASVRDLHVDFALADRTVHALRGVSLDIAPGEVVALVGESGSGKSVLGAALLGLLPRSARPKVRGQVLVEGVDMLAGPQRDRRAVLRRGLGAVFQDPLTSLNPTMRLGRQIREKGASADLARNRLAEVGVPEPERRLRQFPHELSGGLRQRAMIAMALAAGPAGRAPRPVTVSIDADGAASVDDDAAPRLLLADEPTTALDVSVQAQVVLLFDRQRREHGCAVLLVTHDLGVAASIADRIAVMYAGRLCEVGPAAEVLTNPSHPYTRALLAARLSVDGDRSIRDPLPGSPPDPTAPMPGCAFAPRCPDAQEACSTTLPTAQPRPEGVGSVSCLFPLTGHAPPAPTTTPVSIATRAAAVAPVAAAAPVVAVPPALVLDRICKTFDLKPGRIGAARVKLNAVINVSLTVPAGGAVALVGESGCGKTTALRVATGLMRPDSGSVSWADGAARPQMVFQDAGSSLTPWLTVADQIVERLKFAGVDRSDRLDRAMTLLERVGLDARAAAAKPRELSGGQRQRAVIARALASNPSLLVCDEPVSALDASLAVRVLALLEELREDFGVALLVVTHDLSAARRIADETAVMYLGRIVEQAPTDELFANPQHPYTKGLLAAVPTTEPGRLAPTLAGEPPSPIGDRRGCDFVSRCPVAAALAGADRAERCQLDTPALLPLGAANVACHLVR